MMSMPTVLTDAQRAVFQENSDRVLQSLYEWLHYFDDTKFYSTAYIIGFLKLFNEPGLKKSELALYLEINAKVSRSTAERMLRDAEDAGHIVAEKRAGSAGLATFVSPGLYEHCVQYLSGRSKTLLDDQDV